MVPTHPSKHIVAQHVTGSIWKVGKQDAPYEFVQLSQVRQGDIALGTEASEVGSPWNPEFTPLKTSQQKTVGAGLPCGRDRKEVSF